MKELVLLSLLLPLLGISCAHTEQSPSTIQERQIVPDTKLFEDRYSLWGVQGMELPLAAHRYLLARDGKQETIIRTSEDLAPLVKEIASAEQALEFVRFLTSQDIRTFLADIYYSEVHKKAETSEENAQESRWFAIEATQYEAWDMHEPIVQALDGEYRIERFVASYPHRENQDIVPARLLKIWEWVDREGHYRMEIQTILAEGEPVQKILLFQK
ncbi:MAG: hypothetical protein RBT80_03910 [Candidatus Vecturithrix sp.]|jgi:hypothetical protein|nr:hypothetical protein [Candidatus Vecturithrix sp.]